MVSFVSYKVALVVLLAGIPISSGTTAYVFQQRVTELNIQVTSLDNQLETSNSEISELQGQNSQLDSQNQQLQSEVSELQSRIEELLATPLTTVTLIAEGRITLSGFGSVAYVNFTVPSNVLTAKLNLSFAGVEFGVSTRASLLTEEQYLVFKNCNCIYYGNYTEIPTTWSSPMAHSYEAQVGIPGTGKWILAFQHEPSSGSAENFDISVLLIATIPRE